MTFNFSILDTGIMLFIVWEERGIGVTYDLAKDSLKWKFSHYWKNNPDKPLDRLITTAINPHILPPHMIKQLLEIPHETPNFD